MRSQGLGRDVIAHLLAGSFEQPLEDLGQGEDRRPEIEGVALGLEHVEFAADLVVLLVDGDLVSFLAQRDRGGDPA